MHSVPFWGCFLCYLSLIEFAKHPNPVASNELETRSPIIRSRTSHERVNVVAGLFAGQTAVWKAEIACKLLTRRPLLRLNLRRTNRQINGSSGGEEQVPDTRKALELLRG